MTEDNSIPPTTSTSPAPETPAPPSTPLSYSAGSAYAGPAPDADARTWGMLAHLSALAGYIIPLGNVVGPLIVWSVKKEQSPFVSDQAKEAINFNITVLIAAAIAVATICIGIGLILLPVIGIVALVFTIIAAVKANQGEAYRYPLTIRLVK